MKTLLILISSFLLIGNAYALKGEEIYKNASPSIIRLFGGGVSGTGFFFNDEGYIFTNKHVAEKAEFFKGETINHSYKRIKRVFVHPYADVAILKASRKQEKDGALIISTRTPLKGESIFIIGNPKTDSDKAIPDFNITNGVFSNYNYFKVERLNREGLTLHHTAPTLPGASGSPIINNKGEVIGIHSNGMPDKEELTLCKKVEVEIENMIKIVDNCFDTGLSMYVSRQGFNFGYSAFYFIDSIIQYNAKNSTIEKIPFSLEPYRDFWAKTFNILKNTYGKTHNSSSIDNLNYALEKTESKKSNFNLKQFPFPKELNMRMYSISDGVYEYVGKSADGKDVQIRYSKKAGTDAQFSDWNKVNAFVASENKSLAKNGTVETYPILDSGVFHVKSTVTMEDGQKVKYLRIFPGNDMRFDVMVYSKDGDFDKINVIVEKFMNKLRGNQAFSHLYKGKRNISNI